MSNVSPRQMIFVDCEGFGGPEVLKLHRGSAPSAGECEVIVKVFAAGVNRPDILGRRGKYPPPPGASNVLGLEVSGEIVECGANSAWQLGAQVCALTPGGGYAEFVRVPDAQCLPVPPNVSLLYAAGIPETFFTVWTNVFERGQLRAGETLLVHGGSSGIGVTAVQLARARGARVMVTAGSDEKCRACEELGAQLAVNYRTQDFVSAAREFTEGRGVDMVLDMVGGDYFARNVEALAVDGRLVQIATQGGAEATVNLATMMQKRLTFTGSTLRPRSVADKGLIAQALLREVWPLFARGDVRVVVDRVFPLARADDAHRRMEDGSHVGKILLAVGDDQTIHSRG